MVAAVSTLALALCCLSLIGLAYWMMALNQKIERDRRREVLLNRLYKSGKVNRF